MDNLKIYLEEYVSSFLEEIINETAVKREKKGVIPERMALFGTFIAGNSCNTTLIYGAVPVMELMEDGNNEEWIQKEFFPDYKILGYLNIYGNISKDSLLKEKVNIFYDNNEAMKNYLLYRFRRQQAPVRSAPDEKKQRKLCHLAEGLFARLLAVILIFLLAFMSGSINYYSGMETFCQMMGQAITIIMQDE